jgi:hypothetical protein
MNAQSACQQINNAAAAVTASLPSIRASATSSDDFMVRVLVAAGFSTSQLQQLRDTQNAPSAANCSNSAVTQQNNLFDNSACTLAMGCANLHDASYASKLAPLVGGMAQANAQLAVLKQLCTFNVTQTNTADTVQVCQQKEVVSFLTQAPFNTVIQGAINALVSGSPLNCSTFPTSLSVSTVEKAYSSCQSLAALNQSNVALCASAHQSNSASLLQQCVTNAVFQDSAPTAVSISPAPPAVPTPAPAPTPASSIPAKVMPKQSTESIVLAAIEKNKIPLFAALVLILILLK